MAPLITYFFLNNNETITEIFMIKRWCIIRRSGIFVTGLPSMPLSSNKYIEWKQNAVLPKNRLDFIKTYLVNYRHINTINKIILLWLLFLSSIHRRPTEYFNIHTTFPALSLPTPSPILKIRPNKTFQNWFKKEKKTSFSVVFVCVRNVISRK